MSLDMDAGVDMDVSMDLALDMDIPVQETQRAQLARARELAAEKKIVILGEGWSAEKRLPFFITSSYSAPHSVHHVYVHLDRLECHCPRSDPNRGNSVCIHRAVVHDELVRRRVMAQADIQQAYSAGLEEDVVVGNVSALKAQI